MKTPPINIRLFPARIPSLDGLRALSVIVVVLSHFAEADLMLWNPAWGILGRRIFNGPAAVQVFFVISGFIITHVLLEQLRNGGSLARFYQHRMSKLLPTLYLYVVCTWLVLKLFPMGEVSTFLPYALTFTTGLLPLGTPVHRAVSHTWSLTAEEVFYVIWPAAFLASRRWMRWGAIGALLVSGPVLRVLGYLGNKSPEGFLHTYFPLRSGTNQLDVIAVGAVLALVLDAYPNQLRSFFQRYKIAVRAGTILVVAVLYLLTETFRAAYFTVPFADLLRAICIAGFMASTLWDEGGALYKFLNQRWMVTVGLMSYSIYVWQQLFFVRPLPGAAPAPFWFYAPFNLMVIGLVSWLSYRYVEKPANSWGKKFFDARHSLASHSLDRLKAKSVPAVKMPPATSKIKIRPMLTPKSNAAPAAK